MANKLFSFRDLVAHFPTPAQADDCLEWIAPGADSRERLSASAMDN